MRINKNINNKCKQLSTDCTFEIETKLIPKQLSTALTKLLNNNIIRLSSK